ncbi:response regulator transcription factor [Paraburkholderia sp. C35]|uniref:response regulator transcription factor n=1 Tax=Paraburkholderia sp. C35 TaxID=2126993 RepID=UPI000D696165|nr:response regulator transcription factor [Paraburkholderia sp. C35]
MRVLLIADDPQCDEVLYHGLTDAGYAVDWVRDMSDASTAIDASWYEAIVLDLALPHGIGLDLLDASRQSGNSVPIVSLISCRDPETCARILDVGADHCIVKPFEVREVLARIRAVLRRQAGYGAARIGDEHISLDLDSRTLWRHGVVSDLSAREFALMHALLERPGMILSRAQLEERIYGGDKEVESNALDVLIHAMRKRFGRSLIDNVRGIGWTLARSQAAADKREEVQPVRARQSRAPRAECALEA